VEAMGGEEWSLRERLDGDRYRAVRFHGLRGRRSRERGSLGSRAGGTGGRGDRKTLFARQGGEWGTPGYLKVCADR